jgi:hypothetical protein
MSSHIEFSNKNNQGVYRKIAHGGSIKFERIKIKNKIERLQLHYVSERVRETNEKSRKNDKIKCAR